MQTKPKHIVIDARIRRSSTGRYVDRLLDQIQKIDTNNRYTILIQPDDPWRPSAKNFSIVSCAFPQFSFNLIHDVRFSSLLRSLKPDLVHFTMSQQPITYFGNIITTTHDLTMIRFLKPGKNSLAIFWVKSFGYRFLLRWSHMKSKKIIVPTNYVKNDLINYQRFTKDKIVKIYEAAEPASKINVKKPSFITRGNEKFILFVGNAFPHKNPERLIDAFSIINKNHPELHLFFVGKKEFYYNQLEKYAQKSTTSSNIHILGFVPDEEMFWMYRHAQCYVFPSMSEGFGLPGLEAMANDCPVASSNATCLPEVYGSAAHYFNPHDTADIARAIIEIVSSKQLQNKLIKQGHVQIKKYSWEQMAKETVALYKKACS